MVLGNSDSVANERGAEMKTNTLLHRCKELKACAQ